MFCCSCSSIIHLFKGSWHSNSPSERQLWENSFLSRHIQALTSCSRTWLLEGYPTQLRKLMYLQRLLMLWPWLPVLLCLRFDMIISSIQAASCFGEHSHHYLVKDVPNSHHIAFLLHLYADKIGLGWYSHKLEWYKDNLLQQVTNAL